MLGPKRTITPFFRIQHASGFEIAYQLHYDEKKIGLQWRQQIHVRSDLDKTALGGIL